MSLLDEKDQAAGAWGSMSEETQTQKALRDTLRVSEGKYIPTSKEVISFRLGAEEFVIVRAAGSDEITQAFRVKSDYDFTQCKTAHPPEWGGVTPLLLWGEVVGHLIPVPTETLALGVFQDDQHCGHPYTILGLRK